MPYFAIAVVLICTWNFPVSCFGQSKDVSLLSSTVLNAQALRSFDVLIRHEVVKDIAPDDFDIAINLTRLRFDWDNQRFLGISKISMDTMMEGADGKGERKSSLHAQGIVSVDGLHSVGPIPGRIVASSGDVRAAFYRAGLTDVRFIGLGRYPQSFSAQSDIGTFENVASVIQNASNIEETKAAGEYFALRHSIPMVNNPQEMTVTSWHIALDSLMPIHMENSIHRVKGNQRVVDRSFFEDYQWKEYEGVYVPIEVIGNSIASSLPRKYRHLSNKEKHERIDELRANGIDYVKHEVSTSVHLHWFSVNKPLAPELFDKSSLRSMAECQKLVDPHASGAVTLQEL